MKFLILISFVAYVHCNRLSLLGNLRGYGGDSGLGQSLSGGYGDNGYGQQLRQLQQQEQQVQLIQLQPQYQSPKVVEVQNVDDGPIKVLFRTRSPQIEVQQIQQPSQKPTVQRTRTEEEPHRLEHEIVRPVIQEIREIIQPYRRVVQEIQPVIEQVQTRVARGDARGNNGAIGGGLGGQQLILNNGQQELLSNGGQQVLLLSGGQQLQYNGQSLGDLQNSDLAQKLADIGYQNSNSQLWLQSKQSSRSRAASS